MDESTTSGIHKLMSSLDPNNWVLALTISKGMNPTNAESIIYDYIKEIHGTKIEGELYFDLKNFIKNNFDSLKVYTKFCMEIRCVWPFEKSTGLMIPDVSRVGRLIYTP